jgi:hypothetical protein
MITYDDSVSQDAGDDFIISDDLVKVDVSPINPRERAGMAQTGGTPSRLERRKARTRAALVRAAQGFIAAGRVNVPILEITPGPLTGPPQAQERHIPNGGGIAVSRIRSS